MIKLENGMSLPAELIVTGSNLEEDPKANIFSNFSSV